jgi:hypothetical protein
MRKFIPLALATCVIAAAIFFLTSNRQIDPGPEGQDSRHEDVQPAIANAPTAAEKIRTLRSRGDRAAPASTAETSAGEARARSITHQAEEFGRGERENVIVTDGIQMGDNTGFVSRISPYRFFGVFLSSEERAGVFDTIVPGYVATAPDDNELLFEFRTEKAPGAWTVWQEVEPGQLDQSIPLEEPAIGWQYRLTFHANAPSNSPKVYRVTMATHKAGELSDNSPAGIPPNF